MILLLQLVVHTTQNVLNPLASNLLVPIRYSNTSPSTVENNYTYGGGDGDLPNTEKFKYTRAATESVSHRKS